MNRKMMLTLLIIVIVVIAFLSYMFMASDDSGFSFGKGSSVSTAEDTEISEAIDYISEDEEIDIGDII